ncbi:hypothetical protein [Shewanella surugensis]|uniref:Uncharacterized protein n=1 Tax=Shewanella surugensis TaxID=212020 RepID=A0ABT0LB72_9GAMM|nr:hypothetical protein [Shewanella surugensis]MCL1124954.1 hypothetical protein [Shewanella surugensis]
MLEKYTVNEIEKAIDELVSSGKKSDVKLLKEEACRRRMEALRLGVNLEKEEAHKFGNKSVSMTLIAFIMSFFLFLSGGYIPCIEWPSRNGQEHECHVDGWQLNMFEHLGISLVSLIVICAVMVVRRRRIDQLKRLTKTVI